MPKAPTVRAEPVDALTLSLSIGGCPAGLQAT